jgi:hypothetical protein
MTLRWVPGWNGLTEPEAVSYVAAVEAADGEPLEFGVAKAINDFVLGCKNDGIWDAIKASCILAGARTLAGALVPLVGTAPTNFNFVAGNYNRETGLVGDGSTKYLNSNRNNNADPQNSKHLSVYATSRGTNTSTWNTFIGIIPPNGVGRSDLEMTFSGSLLNGFANSNNTATSISISNGFMGVSRNASNSQAARSGATTTTSSAASTTPVNGNILVFARELNGGPNQFINARLAFYSIGESLDLAALDTRVSDLITAIGAAIP